MSAPCPVFGFYLRATLHESTSDVEAQKLLDSLIALIEAHGLDVGGGGQRTIELAVSRDGSQATHADRERVSTWAAGWTHLADITISDLVDLSQ